MDALVRIPGALLSADVNNLPEVVGGVRADVGNERGVLLQRGFIRRLHGLLPIRHHLVEFLHRCGPLFGVETVESFFVVERPPGHRVNVIIAQSAYGNLYLKTEADGEHPNNLLALPECP